MFVASRVKRIDNELKTIKRLLISIVIGFTVSFIKVNYSVYGLSEDQYKHMTLQQSSVEPPGEFHHKENFRTKTTNSRRHHETSLEIINRNNYGTKERKDFKKRDVSDGKVEQEYDYNYEEFKKEYYDESKIKIPVPTMGSGKENLRSAPKRQQNKKPKDKSMENYCSVFLYVRIRVFSCLTHAIANDEPQLKSRCKHVFLFWFLVYLTLAIYFWCKHGWCCCCLSWMCWCCKPYKVMRQAKEILAAVPPGRGAGTGLRVSGQEKKCLSQLEESLYY